ncbi:MAG: transporter substrate-binding domain-containing protein [Rubrivivax sp.]
MTMLVSLFCGRNRRASCWVVPAALGFTLVAATGSAWAQAQTESRLDMIIKRDKVIVAAMSTSPPNGFIDEAGKLTGFEVEFAKLVVKAMVGDPNKVEFITTDAPGRFPAVLSGKADFGIGTATIYPDRTMRVAFTRPYMDSGSTVIVKAGSPIKTLADLNDPKVTLLGANSSGNQDRAKKYAPKATALFFDGDAAAVLALKSGRGNAYQTDVPVAAYFVAQSNGAYVRLPGLLGDVNGNALFMKPGDFALWLALNTIVQEYVAGSRYTEYSELYKKWFGKEPPPARFYPVN